MAVAFASGDRKGIVYMPDCEKYRKIISSGTPAQKAKLVSKFDLGVRNGKYAALTTCAAEVRDGHEKSAATREEAESIMHAVRDENPKWWPYGWETSGHESLYVIKAASTGQPVGVVGWQEFQRGKQRIGSYAIGILPEYRGSGFAKEAVARVIREKSAHVDQVRSYIVRGNSPSVKLAESLGVPIYHEF